MEFRIDVKGTGNSCAISMPWKAIGLDGLDRIREAAECQVALELIHGSIYPTTTNTALVVTEAVARDSGLFDDTNVIELLVPRGYLNRFMKEVPVITRDKETGAVTEARMDRRLSTQFFFEWWVDSGFPTEVTEKEEGDEQ